ncbi:MAG TPA: hypothetical protein VGF45_06070 [Polyangia bacterium]
MKPLVCQIRRRHTKAEAKQHRGPTSAVTAVIPDALVRGRVA